MRLARRTPLVVRDLVWNCGDGACVALQASSRPATDCAALVGRAGHLEARDGLSGDGAGAADQAAAGEASVLELRSCRKTFPSHYIRVTAFDSTQGVESVRMSFIVNRPATEPGPRSAAWDSMAPG